MKIFQRLGEWIRAYDDAHNFTCDLCGREVFGGERVCGKCRGALPWNDKNICPLCGRKVGEPGICLECKKKRLIVDKARSVLLHEGEAARLVSLAKKTKYFYRTAAELMLPFLDEFGADALIFVPMTEKACKKRGYNQSRLIAEELSRRGGVPVLDAVTKTRETGTQKSLGRAEREKNLEGCFHVFNRKGVKNKRLLIIDDALTTGSTVSELATVLKRAGAKEVDALTLTSVYDKNAFGKSPATDGGVRRAKSPTAE